MFQCDSSGVEINGKITAKSGYIGNGSSGFTISDTAIYNGTISMASTRDGIYIGTDGINLGGKFKVDNKGALNAISGKIAGFDIKDESISTNSQYFSKDSGSGIYLGSDGINLGESLKLVKTVKQKLQVVQLEGLQLVAHLCILNIRRYWGMVLVCI